MKSLKETFQNLLLEKGDNASLKEAIHGIHAEMEVPDIRVKGAIDKLFDIMMILDSKYDLFCFCVPGKIDDENIFKIFICAKDYCSEGYRISEIHYSIEEAFELDVEEEAMAIIEENFIDED